MISYPCYTTWDAHVASVRDSGDFRMHFDTALFNISLLKDGWDGSNATKISLKSIENARGFCYICEHLRDRIDIRPTQTGGVLMLFYANAREYEIEFHDDGEITGSVELAQL